MWILWKVEGLTYVLLDPLIVDQTLPQAMELGIRQHPMIGGGYALCVRVSNLKVGIRLADHLLE